MPLEPCVLAVFEQLLRRQTSVRFMAPLRVNVNAFQRVFSGAPLQ